jgi:hypothetical protein
MRTGLFLATVLSLGFPCIAAAGGPPGVIPEPETLMLVAIGAAAVAVVRWKSRKR